jgi:transcriptional regulator with XRE-family HTH domain
MRTIQNFVVRSPGDLARTITEARIVKGITQSELAASTGIDRSYLSRMENGLDSIQLERLFQIFRSLGVVLDAHMEIDSG